MASREELLNILMSYEDNHMIKVLKGLKGCGKSYLLFELYYDYLVYRGFDRENIIAIDFSSNSGSKYKNAIELEMYLRLSAFDNSKKYFVLLDNIDLVEAAQNPFNRFENRKTGINEILKGLLERDNFDIFLTCSNDVKYIYSSIPDLVDRTCEITVDTFSYKDFCETYSGDKKNRLNEFLLYGGIPAITNIKDSESKEQFLLSILNSEYYDRILDNESIMNHKEVIVRICELLSSNIGKLSNAGSITEQYNNESGNSISFDTTLKYIDLFCKYGLISKVERYDIKKRKIIGSPVKYYFNEPGVYRAVEKFEYVENKVLIENSIYNELRRRGYSVNVGILEYNYKDEEKKSKRKRLEIDFIAIKDGIKYYLQSASTIEGKQAMKELTDPLNRINDSFRKIIIVRDDMEPVHDDNGILYLGLERFLLDEKAMLA